MISPSSHGTIAVAAVPSVDGDALIATIEAGLRRYRPDLLHRTGTLVEFAITPPRLERSPFNRIGAITHGTIAVTPAESGLALKYELRLGGVSLMATVRTIAGAAVGMLAGLSGTPLAESIGIGFGFAALMTGASYWGTVASFRALLRVWARARRVPA